MTFDTRKAAGWRLPILLASGVLLLGAAALLTLGHPGPGAAPVAGQAPATRPSLPPRAETAPAAGAAAPTMTAAPALPSPTAAVTVPPSPTGGAVATAAMPVVSAPLARPIRYAAIGASDTVGYGSAHPATENWTARVRAQLPAGTEYHRFARSGITLYDALDTELPQAIAYQPTLVTVWLVVNDALRGVPVPVYQKELKTLLDGLTAKTGARIVLLHAPDISYLLHPTAAEQTRREMRAVAARWNGMIAATAAPYGSRVLIVDLFGPSQKTPPQPDWISADGFHPSAAGYQQIADQTVLTLHQAGWLR